MNIIKRCFFVALFVFCLIPFAIAKDYDGVFGIYRMELHEKSGTFTLSMLDSKSERFKPVLNPLDNSSGTLLYLKAGSRVYPLSKLGGVPVIQNMTENTSVITYNIKNVAEVNLIFSFCSSETGDFTEDSDLVVVDVLVKNISKKTQVYSLRGVLDTFLGENTVSHFSTQSINSLNSETLFNSMYTDKWIKTTDGNNSIKFLLDGETITRPTSVVVANRDILKVDTWSPKFVEGRGFNSLFSYNNSAIGITWGTYKLAPSKLFGVRFYISGATASVEPSETNSYFFTSGKALQSAALVTESVTLKAEDSVEYVVVSTDDEKESDTEEVSEILSVTEGSESVSNEAIDEEADYVEDDYTFEEESVASNVEVVEEEQPTDVAYIEDEYSQSNIDETNLPYVEITPEKLNLEYVAQLIKEIEELEKNPDLYDASRILYLHTELDTILEILGQ